MSVGAAHLLSTQQTNANDISLKSITKSNTEHLSSKTMATKQRSERRRLDTGVTGLSRALRGLTNTYTPQKAPAENHGHQAADTKPSRPINILYSGFEPTNEQKVSAEFVCWVLAVLVL